MNYLDALILGIVQGLTEFLPVSSSGHLVLAQYFLGVKMPGVNLEVLVHVGTLVSVLIYFRARILRLIKSLFNREMKAEQRIVFYLIIGTIPAGVFGLLFKKLFEEAFSCPLEASVALLVTGCILLLPRAVRKGEKELTAKTSLIMGFGQAVAILPGVSRSGSTIVAGMLSGVKPSEAAEFSFLLSIPAILGAVVLEWKELLSIPSELAGHYTVAAVVSCVVGLFSIYAVLSTVKKGKFEYFAYYCFAIGLIGLYHFI